MTNSITVSGETWLDGEERYESFLKNNKTEPNYVRIRGYEIQLKDWKDSQDRVIKFKKYNNNQNPLTVKLTIPNSTIVTLPWYIWVDGEERYQAFIKNNKTEPNYVLIEGSQIQLKDWKDSQNRVNQFKKDNENKNPPTVELRIPTFIPITGYVLGGNGHLLPNIYDLLNNMMSGRAVLESSTNIKVFVEKNNQLPNYVTIDGIKYNMEQYMYISSRLMIQVILDADSFITCDFKKHNIDKPKIIPIMDNIDKQTFYDMNKRVVNYMNKNEKAPLYVASKYGDVQFQAYIYANAKILNYYRNYGIMPNYVSLNLYKNNTLLNYMPKY